MSTCDRLNLQPLGSQPIMPKNLPHHCIAVYLFLPPRRQAASFISSPWLAIQPCSWLGALWGPCNLIHWESGTPHSEPFYYNVILVFETF